MRVFVSYDHSEDVRYKELLRAWDANTVFEFKFNLRSPNVPIDSIAASVIQGALTKKMKDSDYILVIIGKKSYSSKWIRWEIERAKRYDTNLKFAAVKIDLGNTNPMGLPWNTPISNGFTLSGINNALKNAKHFYTV